MEPRVEVMIEKKLVGQSLTMSLAQNRTRDLWQSFLSLESSIPNRVGPERYGLQVYPTDYFARFSPSTFFDKWAAVEVTDFNDIPNSVERLVLSGGLCAVFFHKGAALTAAQTYQYIYGTWLPQSKYLLDDRPHFEVLGSMYRNDHPDSEEEIWIPIKFK